MRAGYPAFVAEEVSSLDEGRILVPMTSPVRRHLASSPFKAEPEPTIEEFAMDDLVCHDAHGIGRVVQMEASAVTVDFRGKGIRITSPYRKLVKL